MKNTDTKMELPPIDKELTQVKKPGYAYLPDEGLKKALEVAVLLQKPLLLTGDPGTGKTGFAHYVAEQYGLGELLQFHTKTTSVARDLLYSYKSLAHFQYAQNPNNKEALEPADIKKFFIRFEALGEAIRCSKEAKKEKDRRRVVLIDEVDKAPRDFPNDLLHELDQMEFEIPELKPVADQQEQANEQQDLSLVGGDPNYAPVVIITSNSEKSLPEPFLRRCVYYHIKFPDDDQLREILKNKLPFGYSDDQWNEIIAHFNRVKKQITKGKRPATAELISWAWLLAKQYGIAPEDLKKDAKLNEEKKPQLKASYSVLVKEKEDWLNIV